MNDVLRKFWLKVREVFEEAGMKRLPGDESFYYSHDDKGVLEGIISGHVDSSIFQEKISFAEKITEKAKRFRIYQRLKMEFLFLRK